MTWLDKEKLMQWLSKEGHYHEGDYYNAIDAVAGEILSGTFNAPEDYEKLYRTYVDRYTETVGERNQLREENAKLAKALYYLEKEQIQDEEENATLKKRLKAIVMAIQDYDDVQYPSAAGLIEWLESVTPYEDVVREINKSEVSNESQS